MLTDQTRWSLGRGNPLVPSRWQATVGGGGRARHRRRKPRSRHRGGPGERHAHRTRSRHHQPGRRARHALTLLSAAGSATAWAGARTLRQNVPQWGRPESTSET
jgi:hypothetical protein